MSKKTDYPNTDEQQKTWNKKRLVALLVLLCAVITATSGILIYFLKDPKPEKYTVAVTASQLEGSVTGAGKFKSGDQVTLTAVPENDFVFVGWYDGAIFVSDNNPYTFTMPKQNKNFEAKFSTVSPLGYTVSATPDTAGEGAVLGLGKFGEGVQVSLVAQAAEGFEFIAWLNGSMVVSNDINYKFVMPAHEVNLTAQFNWVITYESESPKRLFKIKEDLTFEYIQFFTQNISESTTRYIGTYIIDDSKFFPVVERCTNVANVFGYEVFNTDSPFIYNIKEVSVTSTNVFVDPLEPILTKKGGKDLLDDDLVWGNSRHSDGKFYGGIIAISGTQAELESAFAVSTFENGARVTYNYGDPELVVNLNDISSGGYIEYGVAGEYEVPLSLNSNDYAVKVVIYNNTPIESTLENILECGRADINMQFMRLEYAKLRAVKKDTTFDELKEKANAVVILTSAGTNFVCWIAPEYIEEFDFEKVGTGTIRIVIPSGTVLSGTLTGTSMTSITTTQELSVILNVLVYEGETEPEPEPVDTGIAGLNTGTELGTLVSYTGYLSLEVGYDLTTLNVGIYQQTEGIPSIRYVALGDEGVAFVGESNFAGIQKLIVTVGSFSQTFICYFYDSDNNEYNPVAKYTFEPLIEGEFYSTYTEPFRNYGIVIYDGTADSLASTMLTAIRMDGTTSKINLTLDMFPSGFDFDQITYSAINVGTLSQFYYYRTGITFYKLSLTNTIEGVNYNDYYIAFVDARS